MIKVEVSYYLSEKGQKNAVLMGLSGSCEQVVMVDGVESILSSPLVHIKSNGEIDLEFRRITHPYYEYNSKSATPNIQRRIAIFVSTSAKNYDTPAIKFDTPLTTTEQVVEVVNQISQEIAELESKKSEVFEQWQREDEEKIKTSIAREMKAAREQFPLRMLQTRDYFSAEFNAEIEASNAKHQKRYEESKAREAAAKEKYEAEEAAAKGKAEDEAREFEALKASWIETHGSDYIKLAYKEKYDCLALYAKERAALEFPGFEVVKTGSFKKCCCPSESALKESVALAEALKKPVRVVWHNNAEALLLRNFLGGRYDLMKVPTTVDSP